MVTELNEGDYKQMVQNMRSLCGGAQPLRRMLVGVGQFL